MTTQKLLTFCLVWSATLAAICPWAAAAEPRITAELDQTSIYRGESVGYRITVVHANKPPAPQMKETDEFEIVSRGSTSGSQTRIINGRISQSFQTTFLYELTPHRAGTLTIAEPTVEIDGRSYSGQSLSLEVRDPKQQDLAQLSLEVDQSRVYPMQPFTVTLTVAVKALEVPLQDEDPIAVLPRAPQLSIPWVRDDQLDGLEPQSQWRQWLKAMQNPDAGFQIRQISVQPDVFALINRRRDGFLPKPERVTRPDLQGRPATYWEYRFPRTFAAHRLGTFRFGPAGLKGQLGKRLVASRRLEVEAVYATTEAIEVEVRDAPIEGRPDSYTGAMGQFKLQAELNTAEAKVGDPLTLTMTLSGRGTFDTIETPDLSRQESLTQQFRVYQGRRETRNNALQFIYQLRPTETDTTTLPPIPFTYFDIDREQYVTLQTDPIAIDVQPTTRLDSADIAMATADRPDRLNRPNDGGLFGNVTDLSALRDQSVYPLRWLTSLAAAMLVFVALAVATRVWRQRHADVAGQRRRTARHRAHQSLDQAMEHLKSGNTSAAADRAGAALIGLVADAHQLDSGSLTSDEAVERLQSGQIDPSLVSSTTDALASCDGTRYGRGRLTPSELNAMHPLIDQLADALQL